MTFHFSNLGGANFFLRLFSISAKLGSNSPDEELAQKSN